MIVPSPKNPGALRVLLAEDNPANRKVATYVLEKRGHLVEIATNGEEAAALAKETRYDVILMDLQMPVMDGWEATIVIRKHEGDGRRVPIIALTAHVQDGDRNRWLAAGMDGYLTKPLTEAGLLAALDRIVAAADSDGLGCNTVGRHSDS